MKINFDTPIKSLEGVTMTREKLKNAGKPDVSTEVVDLTVGSVAIMALDGSYDDEKNLPGEERVKRFALAMRIVEGGEIELKPEEAVMIKNLVAKAFNSTTIVATVWSLIDAA